MNGFLSVGFFFGVLTGFLCALAVTLHLGVAEGVLCIVGVTALAAGGIPVALRSNIKIFEPIWFVLLNVAIGVTGKAFYICLGPEERVGFLLMDKTLEATIPVGLIVAAGVYFLAIGYLVGPVRMTSRIPFWLARREWESFRFLAVVALLAMVGLASFVVFSSRLEVSFSQLSDLSSKRFLELQSTNYHGTQGYLRWGVLQLEIAFYLIFTRWAVSREKLLSCSGTMVVAFGLLSLAFPVFSSSRWAVLVLIVRIFVIWIGLGRRLKLRYVAPMIALGLTLMGSMLAFRRNLSEWEDIRRHLGAGEMLEVSVGGRHFLDLIKTTHIVDAVPEVLEFQYGKTLLAWVATPVPRSIWPGKPAIRPGGDLGTAVFGMRPGSGVPPGIVGELYMNFGVWGVFVGLFVIGCLLGSLYATLRPHFSVPGVVLIYAILVTRLALEMFGTSVSGAIAKLAQEILPLLLCLLVLGWGKTGIVLRPSSGRGQSATS